MKSNKDILRIKSSWPSNFKGINNTIVQKITVEAIPPPNPAELASIKQLKAAGHERNELEHQAYKSNHTTF